MSATRRVLFVDDDELVRRVLSLVLAPCPWETVVLGSGADALKRVAEEVFDVVVTDIRMPQVSGLDLALWLRDHRPRTRVVLVTGFATTEDEQEIAGLGAMLLRKPFEGPTLIALLQDLMAPAS